MSWQVACHLCSFISISLVLRRFRLELVIDLRRAIPPLSPGRVNKVSAWLCINQSWAGRPDRVLRLAYDVL